MLALRPRTGPDPLRLSARQILFDEILRGFSGGESSAVLELTRFDDGNVAGLLWSSQRAMCRHDTPILIDFSEKIDARSWLNSCGLVVWLFGPEKPGEMYQVLERVNPFLTATGTLFIAIEKTRESSWVDGVTGARLTDEETHAILTRTGYEHIRSSVNTDAFSLWSAKPTNAIAPGAFGEIEALLAQGDWRAALGCLNRLESELNCLAACREHTLLLAACYDLAGKPKTTTLALLEVLRLDPECARAMCGLGRLAALDGDLKGALFFFDAAAKRAPGFFAAITGRQAVMNQLARTKQQALAEQHLFVPAAMSSSNPVQPEMAVSNSAV